MFSIMLISIILQCVELKLRLEFVSLSCGMKFACKLLRAKGMFIMILDEICLGYKTVRERKNVPR